MESEQLTAGRRDHFAAAVDAVQRHRARYGALYEVRARPTPGGTETFFSNLHALLSAQSRSLGASAPWISLEITRQQGALRYAIWLPAPWRHPLEQLLRACYEDLELLEMRAPAWDTSCVAAAELRLSHGRYAPIRSDHRADPLLSVLGVFAALWPGEDCLVQLLARPAKSSWKHHALRQSELANPAPRRGTRSGSGESAAIVHLERVRAKAIREKASGVGFDAALRIAVGAPTASAARERLRALAASFGVYSSVNSLQAEWGGLHGSRRRAIQQRRFPRWGSPLLTSHELAAIWHLPVSEPVALRRARPMHLAPPSNATAGDRVIGEATWAGDGRQIGLSALDSRRHLHVLGPTGSGKTTLLLNLALQDIEAGRGVGVLDPKGDLVSALLERVPKSRRDDVVLITPDQDERCVGINPLEVAPGAEVDLVAENALEIFKRIYARYWGMRTDDILKTSLRTLLARGGMTLAHVPLLLSDATFRAEVTRELDDPFVAGFWTWFNGLSDGRRAEAVGPVLNKLRDFLVRPRLRRLLCQPRSTVRLVDVVDGGKILLADLSAGRWGESAADLVGSFLVASLWQAVLARTDRPEVDRRDFLLYVDEFQRFQGFAMPFGDALAQARSLRLSLTLANQGLGQLTRELRDALSANARSRVVFQCGLEDARYLAAELAPLDTAALESLPRFEMAARLSIGGATSSAFTLRALPPSRPSNDTDPNETRRLALARYGRPRETVDRELLASIRWMGDRAATSGWEGG